MEKEYGKNYTQTYFQNPPHTAKVSSDDDGEEEEIAKTKPNDSSAPIHHQRELDNIQKLTLMGFDQR